MLVFGSEAQMKSNRLVERIMRMKGPTESERNTNIMLIVRIQCIVNRIDVPKDGELVLYKPKPTAPVQPEKRQSIELDSKELIKKAKTE